MTDEADDGVLVALIDDRLEEPARSALAARLEREPQLRARLEKLTAGGPPFGPAFAALLAEAPVERMQEKLDALGAGAEPSPRRLERRRWIGAVAAAVALLLVGWAIGRYGPGPVPSSGRLAAEADDDDWRDSVAEYVSLYSAETFAATPGQAAAGQAALGHLSQALGVELTPASIALPDLSFRRADMLVYDGAPLGQIAYLDATPMPVVFCILRNGEKDAPISVRQHEGVTLASWAHDGRGYVVAGQLSMERAKDFAETLAPRF